MDIKTKKSNSYSIIIYKLLTKFMMFHLTAVINKTYTLTAKGL